MSRGPTIAIAGVALRRLLRDRSNIFFVFIFPLLLILLVGAQFGGGRTALTLAVTATDAGPLGQDLVDALEQVEDVTVDTYATSEDVVDAVSRGDATGGLVIPAGYDQALRTSPRGVVLAFVGRPDSLSPALQSVVVPAVGEQNRRITLADLVIVVDDDVSYETALAQADAAIGVSPEIDTTREVLGTNELGEAFAGLGQFDLGAVQQLNLFVFLSSLTNAAALLQSREYGITRRLLAHPVTAGQILRGEALGRYGVALVQGLYIIVGTLLLFGVNWGDPVAAVAILAALAAVSAGAGLLLGAVARSQQQAGALGIGLSIAIAAIGGSMVPVEVMPEGMRVVARFTPHYWSYEAFAEVVRRGGNVLDVLPELGVLALMTVAVFALAAPLLRRSITR